MKLCDYGCGKKAKYQFKNGKWCCSSHWSKCPYIKKHRSQQLKGKTYEEIHGQEKAKELKKLRSERLVGKTGWSKNKTYEQLYGEEKAQSIKYKQSKKLKGKTYEEILGKEKAIKLKKKQSSMRKGISWQQKFGKEKAEKMRVSQSIRNKKNKGKTYEERYGIPKAKCLKKRMAKIRKNKTYDQLYGKKQAVKIKENISIKNKRTIKKIEQKYLIFSRIEEMRYNPYKPDEQEIQVHCKNHNCPNSKEQGGWFTPSGREIEQRLFALERIGVDNSYFYCCEECKIKCPLYNLRSDPFKDSSNPYTNQEYNIWKTQVLKQDDYECQMCGSKKDLHCHHIIPIKLEPMFSLDPDNGICLCEKCHYKYGHKIGTECSTGNLANKICQNRT